MAFFLKNNDKNVTPKKRKELTTTIVGPEGVSISTDKNIPKITDNIPNTVANNAMDSGELTSLFDAAAGIISIDVINKIPIILTDIATTIVSIVVNNKLTNKGFIPSALARSSSIVTKIKDDQFKKTSIKTIMPPRYIHQRSFEVTVKISPNKNE